MKNLLFTLAVLALGMMTSCSSDDGNTTMKILLQMHSLPLNYH